VRWNTNVCDARHRVRKSWGQRCAKGGEKRNDVSRKSCHSAGDPKHIILGIVSSLWTVYFVWRHDWAWALSVVLASAILGKVVTAGTREEGLEQTVLGKIMLLHLEPMNLTVQVAGSGILLYGAWIHAVMHVLVRAALVLLGHMWGWHKV
jgi:hypothetical protein